MCVCVCVCVGGCVGVCVCVCVCVYGIWNAATLLKYVPFADHTNLLCEHENCETLCSM